MGLCHHAADVRRLRTFLHQRRLIGHHAGGKFAFAAPIFAFGLVAFGFLGMGPVTIAVDSYGPVTDNAQSVYELSADRGPPGIAGRHQEGLRLHPDFENAKYQLEKGDGAGNTFKATAKPVLIGTAVVGATTMVFGIIMLLRHV
jgi:K(+)-stimulated pyrophosphate-energized sodium pump